jgi:hypothetical protein
VLRPPPACGAPHQPQPATISVATMRKAIENDMI